MAVVLAISTLLLMGGTQLSTRWVSGTQTHEAQTKLAWGYEQAKALALRNPCGVHGTEDAAATLLARNVDGVVQLQLLAGDTNHTPDTCAFLQHRPNPQWQSALPRGVVLHINAQVLSADEHAQRMKLDSRSLPLQQQTYHYRLSKGKTSTDEIGTLQ